MNNPVGATGPAGATGPSGVTGATGVVPTNALFTTITTTGEASFGKIVETKQVLSGGSASLNLNTATLFYVTINAATTFSFLNPPSSPKVFSFTVQTVGNGPSYSVNWPASVKWQYNFTPSVTSTSGKIDTFIFLTHDGGSNWFGFISGQNA